MAYQKLTNSEKQGRLGECGEKIIVNMIQQVFGGNAFRSTDPYDSFKDLIIINTNKFDGDRAEIKTQVPNLKMNSFSVGYTQFRKIINSTGTFLSMFQIVNILMNMPEKFSF